MGNNNKPRFLSELANDRFLNSCCRQNRSSSETSSVGIFQNRSTCTHTVMRVSFEKFTAPLKQIKLNWYQECVLEDESKSGVEAYICNEMLTEMLELTCVEARELFKRSKSQTSQRTDETSEYALFEAKRVGCEKKFADIASCRMHLKYDLERNKFCVMKIDQIQH